MTKYPKTIIPSVKDQIKKLQNSGLIIKDITKAESFLTNVNFYRFRGYLFPFYDNSTKKYKPGTDIDIIMDIYRFNAELSSLLLCFTSKIEIALRAYFVEAMISTNDALSYLDPSFFETKENFWNNIASISRDIGRASEIFIKHQFDDHGGLVPIWAVVEVMSFGTLSKVLDSLGASKNSKSKMLFNIIAQHYSYNTTKAHGVLPNPDFIKSWLQCIVLIRNICAHNARLYNRSINKKPTILKEDAKKPAASYYGVYEALMAMKYMRPSNEEWSQFVSDLKNLLKKYSKVIDLNNLNFPTDWELHLSL